MLPPTPPSEIDLWRGAPTEHERLEFKEAKRQFDWSQLRRYCIAIANEGGGKLVLGVADKPPRPVVGTIAFPNPTTVAGKLHAELRFRVEVEEISHPDGRVIVFHIPPRPRGTAYHHEGAYLMRAGESLVPMTEDRLRSIFAEGKADFLEEAARDGIDRQQVIDLLDTQAYFELLQLPYPSTQDAVIERLVADRLVVRRAGSFSILRLAALTLAKRLTDFPELHRKAPRIVVYDGNDKLKTRLDHSSVRGYAAGFRDLVEFIVAQLPQNEVIENTLRREEKLAPEVVIRELLANALIHQDLTVIGARVMVEIYQNRVVLSNPGEPIVPVERFIDGYRSRNERLADLMRQLSICEEKSSGIDRVVDAAEAYQLPAPVFRSDPDRTSVTVFGPRPFSQMDREDRIRATYQHCALRWVMNEKMTNTSLRKRFGLSESKAVTVSQIIRATVQAKLIKADERAGSSKRHASYLPFWA
ncbi:MAG: MloB [Planctomycetota bacterium]|nr:MAG: MloB [Planctomycetota bacterium]